MRALVTLSGRATGDRTVDTAEVDTAEVDTAEVDTAEDRTAEVEAAPEVSGRFNVETYNVAPAVPLDDPRKFAPKRQLNEPWRYDNSIE